MPIDTTTPMFDGTPSKTEQLPNTTDESVQHQEEDLEDLFKTYENKYIKDDGWNGDGGGGQTDHIREDEDHFHSTPDDIVSAVHDIVQVMATTNDHIIDEFVANAVTQSPGNDERAKEIHFHLSTGGSGDLAVTTHQLRRDSVDTAAVDRLVNMHNKVTTEYFNRAEVLEKQLKPIADDVVATTNDMEQNMEYLQSKVDEEIGKEISKSTHDPIAALADILEPETRALYTKDIPGMKNDGMDNDNDDTKIVTSTDDDAEQKNHKPVDETFEYSPLKDTSGFLIEDPSAASRTAPEPEKEMMHQPE